MANNTKKQRRAQSAKDGQGLNAKVRKSSGERTARARGQSEGVPKSGTTERRTSFIKKTKHGLIFRRNKNHETLLFEKKTFFLLITASVLTLLVYFFGTDARQFLTNIVAPLPEHAPFDGTTSPIKQIPNWVKLTETERKATYSAIPPEKLIPVPAYIPERLVVAYNSLAWNNPSHDQIRNEKITYTVPYLGNYQIDGAENVGSHPAVDIKVPEGTPVYAIANGVVVKAAATSSGFGTHVVIQHNKMPLLNDPSQTENLFSAYAHLSQILVADRQVVTKGQLIAYSGNSGFSTTPHLHFQLDRDSASWHPYWPFTSKEASDAGLSFVGAINAGLGKDRALVNTLNPMKYVQQFQSGGSLVASAEPIPMPPTAPLQPEILNFKIELSGLNFMEGEKITPKISLWDGNGNMIKNPTFEERVKVELVNNKGTLNKDYLVAADFSTGENGTVEIRNTVFGTEKLILRFRDREFVSQEFTINAKEIAISPPAPEPPPSEILPSENSEKPLVPKTYTEEDKKRLVFPRLEISQTKTSLFIEDSAEILVQYFDENTKNVAPSSGVFFVTLLMGEGTLTKNILNPVDFESGQARLFFQATKEGQAAISISGNGLSGFSEPFDVKTKEPPPPPPIVPEVPVQPEVLPEVLQTAEKVFSDVENSSTHETALRYLKKENVIQGYADGTFKPDKAVLRVEALKMIFEALKVIISKENTTVVFPDIVRDSWYVPYVDKAYKDAVVQGYPDGTFKPNANVSLVEFYKMLFLAAKIEVAPQILIKLPNGVKSEDWYAPYIQEAVKKNILEIKSDLLEPGKPMTRGEIADALYRLMVLRESGKEKFEL